ncbi:hypothetical protein XHV734_0504 [Xanthomonas hortorum pv. vitians]|nr:hypothetical protein XHV734_0504 [Xanthomonas hortorum pv. vitians]
MTSICMRALSPIGTDRRAQIRAGGAVSLESVHEACAWRIDPGCEPVRARMSAPAPAPAPAPVIQHVSARRGLRAQCCNG